MRIICAKPLSAFDGVSNGQAEPSNAAKCKLDRVTGVHICMLLSPFKRWDEPPFNSVTSSGRGWQATGEPASDGQRPAKWRACGADLCS
mmetsp:Transcript_24425/g.40942  ORF Transcript_24425/g.40942 Transcript_24425/m.40942 type:complete len:89 (-) Transcript_24425:1055-1321(-)